MRKRSSLFAIKYGRSVFAIKKERERQGAPVHSAVEKLICLDLSPHPEGGSGIPLPSCSVLMPACEHREREGASLASTSTCACACSINVYAHVCIYTHLCCTHTNTHIIYIQIKTACTLFLVFHFNRHSMLVWCQ